MLERIRSKNLHRWLGTWLADAAGRALRAHPPGPRHLLFALCDHYEPLWHNATREVGRERVRAWAERYPAAVRAFRDADGRPPRHSFFYPGEQYAPEFLEPLAGLVRQGLGEVEVHLHHDGDTAETLRRSLARAIADLDHHGLMARDGAGRPRWAFIHGNWCLANSRADGRWCGVDAELPLLFQAGCYADFTFPSAPDETQPTTVNRIYWPEGDLSRRAAHRGGHRARVGVRYEDRLLLIQGPLGLARRAGRFGVRVESGTLQAGDPPGEDRVASWVAQDIHVEGRPEWVFVKVHTHGATESNARSLLGPEGEAMHRCLTTRYNDGQQWILHYVTAREMYNIAMAAMEGREGDPGAYRDHVVPPPPAASAP
jgi:hypothetical protein